jgi:hypothetical protein
MIGFNLTNNIMFCELLHQVTLWTRPIECTVHLEISGLDVGLG